MDATQTPYHLSRYAKKCIHHKARQIVGQAGYTEDDVEDIEGELTVYLYQEMPNFDPDKASENTFVAHCIDSKLIKLVRHREAAMRDIEREEGSLNEEVFADEKDPVQYVTTLGQDEHDLRVGKYTRPAEERRDLVVDVALLLAELPPKLREAAELLMTLPITEAAAELGMPRSTFYKRRIEPLGRWFDAKGLSEYFFAQNVTFSESAG